METSLEKDIKNIRTLSRLAMVDEAYQEIYCREELSFVQMLLLCQMSMYGIAKEVVQELSEAAASADEIKQAFREQILSEAFSELKAMEEMHTEAEKSLVGRVESLLADVDSLKKINRYIQDELTEIKAQVVMGQERIEKKLHKTMDESQWLRSGVFNALDAALEQRKYPPNEYIAWRKIKRNLKENDVKTLSVILRALNAGVMPSKLVPYLENSSTEQLELIVYILTREKVEGDKTYGK